IRPAAEPEERKDMPDYVLAIDQGTTSTRAIIFDHAGQIVESGQIEHEQILPKAGWVEHDPMEIWRNTREVVGLALARAPLSKADIAAVGITNQRETAVVWDKNTGEPVYNAIVWQDTRTQKIVDELGGADGPDKYKAKVGLPLATYFSGPKIRWILENVEGARAKAEAGDLLFGNTDAWLLWNMTGGTNGGVHVTDVTNASRTMLMDLETLQWDADIAADMGIPMSMLPEIRSSSEEYGKGREGGMVPGVPIAGILGDQQAATFGQACFEVGMAKNTYGTGNFMLINTGEDAVPSENGLLTTLAYKIGDQKPIYALEGSIAVTGSLVQWLRDNPRLIPEAPPGEDLAMRGGRRPLGERPADHTGLQDRRPEADLRPGGLDRSDRVAGAVAAGQPRPDHRGAAGGGPGQDGGGQRRRLLRPRLLRPVRPALAPRRPGRTGRAHPVREQGAPGPRHPGGDSVPDP